MAAPKPPTRSPPVKPKHSVICVIEWIEHRLEPLLNTADRTWGEWTLYVYGIVALIGTIDFLAKDFLSLGLFYLAPVIFGAWAWPREKALLLALFSGLVEVMAHSFGHHLHDPWFLQLWNGTSTLLLTLMVGFLVSKTQRLLRRERLLARVDPLTMTLNLRALYEAIEIETGRSKRESLDLTLVYIDIDNFKYVNDKKGHAVGNELLCLAASTIRENLRPTDVISRVGGDEFALLLPSTGIDSAKIVVSKLHHLVMETMRRQGWPVSLSVGSLTCKNVFPPPVEMLKLTDQLMYNVKNKSKNGADFAVYSGQFSCSDNL